MIYFYRGEEFKEINVAASLQLKYAVSNQGRAASFTENVIKDGKLLAGSVTSGYRTLNLHVETGNGTIYIHREVAKLFCTKKSPKHKFVIHNNHKKSDNLFKNLKWATMVEVSEHQQSSPDKIAYKKKTG